MARNNPAPVCRLCGRPGIPRKCSFCGRIGCDGCVKDHPHGNDCCACRLVVYTTMGDKRIRLRVADNNTLYSACGEVARNIPVRVEYLVPEAVEQAGRLKYEIGRRGYLNITIQEGTKHG